MLNEPPPSHPGMHIAFLLRSLSYLSVLQCCARVFTATLEPDLWAKILKDGSKNRQKIYASSRTRPRTAWLLKSVL